VLRRDPLANPEELIRRVYAYVAYRIGEGPDAEDVTSEAFARALRYRDSFDQRRGDPTAWLIGIARRCIAAHFGDRVEVASELVEGASTGDLADDAIERIELRRVLASLDDRDRELVALRYGADLSARQIAELLELRVNTVEVALHRALRRLRAGLAGDVPVEPVSPVSRPRLASRRSA
jgi:RNA polymerase sigma-70 factor (ECF subfamily)